jgi:glycosyltransferase involved in cell wall biosynthesis
VVTLVSQIDRDFLLKDGVSPAHDRVIVCSNGVDVTSLPFSPKHHDPVIAFIGNMTTLQNMDACLYFIEEVLPMLLKRREITFRIVGKITEADARRLRAHPGVEVTGTVTSVAAAVDGARAAVCPIRIGAGVQNKLLEYMALGLPAISSSIGLEGFAARPGTEVLVADSPAEYSAHIDWLFQNPERAKALALAARRYVERSHDWEQVLSPLKEKVRSLVGITRPTPELVA